MKLRLECSDKLQTMQEDSGGEDCTFYLENHRVHRGTQRTGATAFFLCRFKRRGRVLAVGHYSFSVHTGFYFILKIFPCGNGEKNPSAAHFSPPHPVQKKRRPVCHQCINVEKKGGGFVSAFKIEQSEGRIRIPPDEVQIPHVVL